MKSRTILVLSLALSSSLPLIQPAAPVSAQTLSDGDYELCAIYDRRGELRGHDSVCLARQREDLRRLQRREARAAQERALHGPYFCPIHANQGRGWSVGGLTGYGYGTRATGVATVDSPVNGRLCTPRPVGYLSNSYD